MDIQNLYEAVAGHYHLRGGGSLIRLEGGDKNRVYKISGAGLVVRVYQPTAPLDGIAFEHKLMSLLSKQISCVPKPLRHAPGKTYFIWRNHPVAVLPYMVGDTPADKDCENAALCYNAGNLLGQMHRIVREHTGELPVLRSRIPLMEMDAFSNHLYDWEKGRGWLSSTKFLPELPYLKEQLDQQWMFLRRLKSKRLLPVHGDYYHGNLLWDGRRITGVIDFDDARMEWAEFEIARALWEFARDDSRLVIDQGRQDAFLGGYAAARPHISHDLALYMEIIKTVRLFEILSTATSMINGDLLEGWNEEGEEYHWRNLLWCKRLGGQTWEK